MRCGWVTTDADYIKYHDEEWGVPVHQDNKLFEFVVLESAQAGLSWLTILRKRQGYRDAFDHFDPTIIANYDERKIQALMQNQNIVRNKLKITSTVSNAKAFLQIQDEYGSFATYLWNYVEGHPIINHWATLQDVPPHTPLSDSLAKDLKKRGFKFMGTTVCYSYMQAVGLVMDHTRDCFRYKDLAK